MSFREILDFHETYANALGANLLAFNYRGVGGSTGIPTSARNLGEDGEIVVKYLFEQYHPAPSQVLLHGWSLGGGVAAHVGSSLLHSGPVISDRSFSSLSNVAASWVDKRTEFGSMIGGALGKCDMI